MFSAASAFSVSTFLVTYRPTAILYRLAACVVAGELAFDVARCKLSELVALTGGFRVQVKVSSEAVTWSPEEGFYAALREIACIRLSTHLAYQRMTWLEVTVCLKGLAEEAGWDLSAENSLVQRIFQLSEKIRLLKQQYDHSTFPVCVSQDQFRIYMNRSFLNLLGCPIEDNDPLAREAGVSVDYFQCMNHFLALPYMEDIVEDDLSLSQEKLHQIDAQKKVPGHFVNVYRYPYFAQLFNCSLVSEHSAEDRVACLRWITEKRDGCYIAIAEDCTEKQRLLEETSKRVSAEAKAKLAEEMVHDVHNTLQVVLGNTDLLKESISTLLHRLERKGFVSGLLRNDMLETLRRSVEQVDGIVLAANYQRELAMRILTDSKLRAGGVVLQKEPINLKNLLSSVAKMYAVIASEKSIVLDCQLPKTNCYSLGDALALQTILTNLIGNAIKFTESGRILLLLETLEKTGTAKQTVIIRVADTGIGMSAERCAHLRNAIHHDAERLESLKSFGLGLSICQRLVNLMKGRFEIESEPDVGTTVSVTLELESLSLDQYHHLQDEDWLAA